MMVALLWDLVQGSLAVDNPDHQPDDDGRHGPTPCVSCRAPLPILICPGDPSAVSVACAFCGERYRGMVLPIPDLRSNIIDCGSRG